MAQSSFQNWIKGLLCSLGLLCSCLAADLKSERDLMAYGRLSVRAYRTENSSLPSGVQRA